MFPFSKSSNEFSSSLEATLKLGKDQIVAKSDGGLQITIAARDDEGNETSQEVIYERAYYQLTLEVNHRFFFPQRI